MEQENKMTVATILAKYVSKVVLFIMIGISLYFYFVFRSFDVFPLVWGLYALGGILFVALLSGLLCFIPKIPNVIKIIVMILNILISASLAFASWYLPSIRSQIEKSFAEIPLQGVEEINFYVLKDASSFDDYANEIFIIQKALDAENQNYALLVAKRELHSEALNTLFAEDIFEAVDMLYAQTGDVLVMNASYVPLIESITGYEDFSNKVDIVYTVHKKLQVSTEVNSVDVTNKPFHVLIVGNDKWADDVVTTGRTDLNLLATIHPQTKQVSVISLPQDAYIPNACLYDKNDKLTYAGIYGIECTEQSIEKFLDIDIRYYVVVNFTSLVNIVDAVDGITIDNPYTFTTSTSETFEEGILHLTGKDALAYVSEKKNLENGESSRGKHQTLVLQALIDTFTEASIITKVDQLLDVLDDSFKSNLPLNELYALAQMQLDDMAIWNVVSYTLTGESVEDYVASLGETSTYSVVNLNEAQIEFVKGVMQEIMDGKEVTQQELPE